ncbi:hypothetical protein BV96_01784 [Sphingomonas paucimobilis]|nr:hypothetical protein BV96_01784 [Sphingomonas paucimobilis]
MTALIRRLAALEAKAPKAEIVITSDHILPLFVADAAAIACHLGGWIAGDDAWAAFDAGIEKANGWKRRSGASTGQSMYDAESFPRLFGSAVYAARVASKTDFGCLRPSQEQRIASVEAIGPDRDRLADGLRDIFDRHPELDFTRRRAG